VPGVIVQGSRDLVTPPATAQALHRAWPRAQWHGVPAAGHASSHPAVARALIAATDQFAHATVPAVPAMPVLPDAPAFPDPNNKTTGDRHEREGRFLA
jgi:hypothetical protein